MVVFHPMFVSCSSKIDGWALKTSAPKLEKWDLILPKANLT